MAAKRKILNDGLTNKQRILRMVDRWDDDISFEQAVYHMQVMQAVMDGIKSAEEGECIDHDELFDELERLCDEEEKSHLVAKGRKRIEGTASTHRKGRLPANGKIIHKSAQKVRKPAS